VAMVRSLVSAQRAALDGMAGPGRGGKPKARSGARPADPNAHARRPTRWTPRRDGTVRVDLPHAESLPPQNDRRPAFPCPSQVECGPFPFLIPQPRAPESPRSVPAEGSRLTLRQPASHNWAIASLTIGRRRFSSVAQRSWRKHGNGFEAAPIEPLQPCP
jgi:hypothetical protein